MLADAVRHFYAYHFAANREIWDNYVAPLTQEQLLYRSPYSTGSVRNQVIHMISVDRSWFGQLRGDAPRGLNPVHFHDRKVIRARWDAVEQEMRDYLAALRDDMLFAKPFDTGEDKDLILYQVLLHVVNHGTDHRAQLLRLLHDLGVKTTAQDYVFYAYEHPEPPAWSRG